jgi:hypothetical protein
LAIAELVTVEVLSLETNSSSTYPSTSSLIAALALQLLLALSQEMGRGSELTFKAVGPYIIEGMVE